MMRKKIPQQSVKERVSNFFEVALGFSREDAEDEAGRCLQCKNAPCSKGCPVQIDIPAFIKLIKVGERKEALAKIKEKNNLPAVCGRVCPQEEQCEAACVLNKNKIPINIGALERYAADYEIGHNVTKSQGHRLMTGDKKVAVVGSGPAGLTCAADLVKMGYQAVLFDLCMCPGGF